MKRSNWGTVYIIVATIGLATIGLAITCVDAVTKASQHKWDTIIARCHDVDGRDYAGCLERENLEWNRGGKSGSL